MKTPISPLLVALTALSAGACVPDGANQFLYITGNISPDNSCLFVPSETGPFTARGTLDVLLSDQYIFGASIKNAMPSTIALNQRKVEDPRIEANILQIEQVTVQYEYPEGFDDVAGIVGTSHSEFTSATLHPGQLGAMTVPLLDEQLAALFADKLPPRDEQNPAPGVTLLTKIRLKGQMLDGTEVESDEFIYPLNICKGCLLFFPADAALPDQGPNCRNDAVPPQTSSRCLLGQDRSVDCRICRELKPIALRPQCEPF